jgi:hypothetical protein
MRASEKFQGGNLSMKNLEAAIGRAVAEAIATMGVDAFKKTSFFISSHRADLELKKAA